MQLHIPVLLDEVLSLAKEAKDGYYLDATLGYAQHASAILKANSGLKLLGFDQDSYALECSKQTLSPFAERFALFKSNFKDAFAVLKDQGILPSDLRFVLADIGVSSVQLDRPERGFSFDAPNLDMRMNTEAALSAYEVLNTYSSSKLSQILIDYAQLAPKLAADLSAKFIQNRPINSCAELSKLIGNASLKGRSISLKTLVFQAIRIEVNAELEVLKSFLNSCADLKDCMLVIISFHSLEDGLIKQAFKRFANSCICDEYALCCTCGNNHSLGRIITKKPICPSPSEIKANSRSSCAKLRAFYFKGV